MVFMVSFRCCKWFLFDVVSNFYNGSDKVILDWVFNLIKEVFYSCVENVEVLTLPRLKI